MKEINFNAVIIEASAGTGKTRYITEKFIRLLSKNDPASDMRKILAVTFSEKAAIEMKDRILRKIYETIYEELSEHKKVELENAMLKLRISTIHSFCRLLLKRFSFYQGIDPFFTIIDKRESVLFSYRAFNKFLNSDLSGRILPLLKDAKLQTLRRLIFSVGEKHPYATIGSPEGEFTEQVTSISRHLDDMSRRLKKELSILDFNDLEIMTYEILVESPGALTILEDFDEKSNFIFVDEFQDTNLLQWKIIYKLIEEWLSGYGAKAEAGVPYGVFLVGDRKQSIYKFRGAEGKVFDEAKKTLSTYCEEKKLLDNYRSTPIIINFINRVFEDIYPWTEEKLSPGIKIEMPSCIEINLSDIKENDEAKEDEYKWVIGKIFELIDSKKEVFDKKIRGFRPIEFRDIAILLRKKAGKKFPLLEGKLKESGIPFVVLGGIGFYKEPEIILLLSLVLSLIDPSDIYSLWNLKSSSYRITADMLQRWRDMLKCDEMVDVIERIIKELGLLDDLSTQQRANVEKFLMILDGWRGTPLYTISHNLRTMMFAEEEAKADIFSEHQNAVRVLTVHNAKGIEFPAVFLINIEDGNVNTGRENIFYRKIDGEPPYRFIFKKEADKEYEKEFLEMLEEEEKRVLYVALTRACQYLFISGVKKGKGSIWTRMIERFKDEFPYSPAEKISMTEQETERNLQKNYIPEQLILRGVLTSYTGEKEKNDYHYEGTLLGDIAHKLMYEVSLGKIKDRSEYKERVKFYLKKVGFTHHRKMKEALHKIYSNIEEISEFKKIVENREQSFSEMPFIVEIDGRIYTGFIDRIILSGENICCIYDYKMEESPVEKFKEQMDIYEEAVRKIFPERKQVKRYIVFLKSGNLKEI